MYAYSIIRILVLTKLFFPKDENKLYLYEVIFLFQYTCKSVGIVIQEKMPKKEILRVVAKKAFLSADIDNNGYLTIDEIELWCMANKEWFNFLS